MVSLRLNAHTHIMLKCDYFRILVTKARNVYLGVTRKYQQYASYMFRPFLCHYRGP